MKDDRTDPGSTSDPRRQAEAAPKCPTDLDELPAEEARRLLHDLFAHQIELEMENGELRRTQAELAEENTRLEREIAERMQAVEALRESETYYRAVVEEQSELICRFLPDRTLTFVNQAFCRYTGQEREALIGHGLSVSTLQEEQISFLSPERPIVTYERREEMSNGEIRWMRWTVRALLDEEGRVSGYQAGGRDVTERRNHQAERERLLAQSIQDREAVEELVPVLKRERIVLGTIMEHTHAQLAYLDPQFNFLRVNAAYARGSGYSAQDLIGRNHFALFPHAENQTIFEQVRDTGQAVVFHAKPFVFPDRPELGTTYWDWTLVPVMGASGNVEGLVLSLLDVTARERAKTEREAQWARQSLLVEVSRRILEENTVQGVLHRAVDAARRLCGARLAISGFISPDAVFQIGPTYRAEGAPPCPPGQSFTIERGGVYLDLVQGRPSLRLTDEEMRRHPAWRGLPEGHVPLHGFLGARLAGQDGRAMGVIMLSDKAGGDFAAEDEASLVQLASLTSLGLQHIAACEEAERRADELDAVFDAMLDAVIVYGADGVATRANCVAANTAESDPVGVHRAELIQAFATRTMDERPVVADDLPSARALRGETVTGERFLIRSAQGHDLIVLASAVPLWKEGVVSGAVLLWHDITDQERLFAENRSQREFLEHLMAIAPVGIAVMRGPEHRYEYVNSYYQALTGMPDVPMVGRTMVEVFPDMVARGMVDLLDEVYQTGAGRRRREHAAPVGPEGREAFWNVDLVPLRGLDGEVVGVLVVIADITDLVAARGQLDAERATLKAIIDNAPDGIIVTDKACRIMMANDAANRFHGGSVQVGQSYETHAELPHWHADGTLYSPRQLPLARAALDGETCINEELAIGPADGFKRDLLANTAPIRDAEGMVTGAVAVLHDITELEQIQRALRQHADRLQFLREVDRAILASQSAEEIATAVLRYLRQLVPCTWASVTTFDRQADQVSLLAAVTDGGTGLQRGWRGPLKEAWFVSQLRSGQAYVEEGAEGLASSSLFEDLRGRGEQSFVSVPLVLQDQVVGSLNLGMAGTGSVVPEQAEVLLEITAELTIGIQQIELHDQVRRHADELEQIVGQRTAALRASQARLQAIYDGAPLGIALVGGDGRLIESNPAFRQIVGYGSEELRGKSLGEFTHPDDVRADSDLLEELIADRRDRYHLEQRYVRKDGRVVWVALSVTAIRGDEGQSRLALKIVEDVTEKKQAHEALIRSEKLSATGRLATSLAHEINNPLQAVIGCLDLAEGELAEGGDPGRYLEVAQRELSRAARVVSQLRDLHRRSSVRERELVNVNALVEQVLAVSSGQCKRCRVEVQWHGADDLPLLSAVPDHLQQVFLNLVLNAVDAMPDGGLLKISTARTDMPDGVEVEFADTGAGIPADHLLHLFEPFYTTRPDGLGLGLYISQNIVEHHGGRIEVESTVGQGTTFTVWLPR
jgi:PAS domain S-box-containing protein